MQRHTLTWSENEEWSPAAIINEECKIENSTIKHRSEARIIQHSTFHIQHYINKA